MRGQTAGLLVLLFVLLKGYKALVMLGAIQMMSFCHKKLINVKRSTRTVSDCQAGDGSEATECRQ